MCDVRCARYVTLVKRGTPDFIEIKGVTFCGDSRSELSMSNVPWHEEVQFVAPLQFTNFNWLTGS